MFKKIKNTANLKKKIISLKNVPLLRSFIRNLDSDIGRWGLQESMRKTLIRHGVKLVVDGLTPGIEEILQSKPVVMVANHPFEMEVITLLAALPKRKDAFLIMNSDFLNIVPKLDPYMIPVYVKHHEIGVNGNNFQKVLAKIFGKFHPSPTLPPEVEHQKNIESISLAADKVRVGAMVIMFPGAKGEKDGRWKPGLGYLLKNIGKIKEGYLIKAFISGTSNLDYLRFIPKASKILATIKVNFSEPLEIKEILKTDNNPKVITAKLEKQYEKWSESLK